MIDAEELFKSEYISEMMYEYIDGMKISIYSRNLVKL